MYVQLQGPLLWCLRTWLVFIIRIKNICVNTSWFHDTQAKKGTKVFLWYLYCNNTLARSGDRILVGTRFSARPDRAWSPPSLLYNAYRVFPGVKCGQGVLLTTHPLLAPRSWKIRAIPLPPLGHNRACNEITLPLPLPLITHVQEH